MNRRQFIMSAAAAMALPAALRGQDAARRRRMGVTIASYGIRSRSKAESEIYPPFKNALDVIEHCHRLGAGGVQVGVGGWQNDFANKVRDRRELYGMYLEGQIGLPRNERDLDRFESEVKAAGEAGATILRTVCLGGRRYETFDSAEAFREFREDSWKRLVLAERVMGRHRMKLAVENHKDWRVPELLDILGRLKSEWVGVTLDTGNSIALLEDPMAVVQALAPHTFTTHFKDMAVKEYEKGFLLSEVPLGDGFLELSRIIEICEKANPAVQFNLEMITRDPLEVPCLAQSYWVTFESLPASDLAHALAMVKANPPVNELPRVSGRTPEGQLAFEDLNVQKSFSFARSKLGLG